MNSKITHVLDPFIVRILDNNTLKIQRQFYEKINTLPSATDHKGFVYGASHRDDKNTLCNYWIKLGRTKRNPLERMKELKCNLNFSQATKYNKKCERCIHLLFNYLSVIRQTPCGKKQIEWFHVTNIIDIEHAVQLIAKHIDNDGVNNDVNNDIINKSINITEIPDNLKNVKLVKDSMIEDDKYEDIVNIFTSMGLAISTFVSDCVTLLSDSNNNTMSRDIKQDTDSHILKIFNLDEGELSLYYYNDHAKDIWIVLTDKRFVKLEKGQVVSQSMINDIDIINHIKGGIFYFDKIQIIEKNNRVETFGIYKSSICEDFIKLLKNRILKSNC
jgi:hypothetical protein